MSPVKHLFDGETFDKTLDGPRLNRQLDRVFALMSDGKYRTLREIAEAVGGSEAGVSARLRDLKKPRFGSYRVGRVRQASGVHYYKVYPKED